MRETRTLILSRRDVESLRFGNCCADTHYVHLLLTPKGKPHVGFHEEKLWVYVPEKMASKDNFTFRATYGRDIAVEVVYKG